MESQLDSKDKECSESIHEKTESIQVKVESIQEETESRKEETESRKEETESRKEETESRNEKTDSIQVEVESIEEETKGRQDRESTKKETESRQDGTESRQENKSIHEGTECRHEESESMHQEMNYAKDYPKKIIKSFNGLTKAWSPIIALTFATESVTLISSGFAFSNMRFVFADYLFFRSIIFFLLSFYSSAYFLYICWEAEDTHRIVKEYGSKVR